MDIKKWFGSVGGTVASLLFLFTLACLIAFSFIGMGRTGFDKQVGDTLGSGVELTIKEGGPAIANVFGPAADVIGESASQLLPTGKAEWGFVTIDWDQMRGNKPGANDSGGGDNNNGGGNNSGGESPTQAPPSGCTRESTPDSEAALRYWNDGDWDNAITKFGQTDLSTDCLAASMADTLHEFQIDLEYLMSTTDQEAFVETLNRLISINPRYRMLYAARAYYDAQVWSVTTPLDFTKAPDVFKGASVSVVSVKHRTWAGEQQSWEIDVTATTLKFDWGKNWEFTTADVTVDDAKALAKAFGAEDENVLLKEGGAMLVPGDFVPSDLPTPKDPRTDYVPPQQPTPFVPSNEPTPTPGPQNFAQTCTNIVKFVSETVKDNTAMTAGETFTKSWTLQNAGTCTWTTGYTLVFDSGEQMGGTSVSLPNDVAPGSSVTISVTLTAPSTAGTYTGNWKIADASGTRFGLAGDKAFWVKIRVQ